MRPDIHTLTGAYAADALPDDERRFFEAHLAECEACQEEVAELQATAARLGAALYTTPPAGMKAAVMSRIDTVRQEPPAGPDRVGGPDPSIRWAGRPDWLLNLVAPAAAVLGFAVLGLALLLANMNTRLADMEAQTAQMTQILAAPDVETVAVEGPDGAIARVVMSASLGQAVFLTDGMPSAPENHVYELWLVHRHGPVTPAGIFDTDEHGRVTQLVSADMTTVAALAVTVEPPGGSPQPTSDPLMVVELEG